MSDKQQEPYKAPLLQEMTTDLGQVRGVVVRQVTQFSEAILQTIGLPYEAKNKYQIAPLPDGKCAAREHDQADVWNPTHKELESIQYNMQATEDSGLFNRIFFTWFGCLNNRPLTLHVSERGKEVLLIRKPFKCGGELCCPLEMTVEKSGNKIGMVKQDFDNYCGKCVESCCRCTWYNNILEGSDLKYVVRLNACCCGRTNNCCGATCCKNNLIMDILDKDGKVVATIQKTYAPSDNCDAFCRCCYHYDNYIVEFPTEATTQQRELILAAVFQVDYGWYEAKGGDDNN